MQKRLLRAQRVRTTADPSGATDLDAGARAWTEADADVVVDASADTDACADVDLAVDKKPGVEADADAEAETEVEAMRKWKRKQRVASMARDFEGVTGNCLKVFQEERYLLPAIL